MKATHEKGSRTIKLTDLPTTRDDGQRPPLTGLPASLEISIGYTSRDPSTILDKAISLDGIVIPAIVAALNRRPPRKTGKVRGPSIGTR
jgi:hypothetical protein